MVTYDPQLTCNYTLEEQRDDRMKRMFHSSNKLTELGRLYCSWPELMAVSIVVAESILSCAWKLWGKPDSTKIKIYLLVRIKGSMWSKDVCLWAGNAFRQEMRSQLIGSLDQHTQAAAERACLQLSSAHLNRGCHLRGRGLFSPLHFPIAGVPIFWLSEQNGDLLTYNDQFNPFWNGLGAGNSHWKLPAVWMLCPSSSSMLWSLYLYRRLE